MANRTPFARLAALCALGAAAPLVAADLVVTRYDDPTPGLCAPADCSLREAVIAANQDAAADRILLSAGTYTLTRTGNQEDGALVGDLDLLADVEILGVAANLTVVHSSTGDRVFDVPSGVRLAVRFADLAITFGSALQGAAIRAVRTDLAIERCEVTGNFAGSALSVTLFGTLALRDSTIAVNQRGLECAASHCELENATLSTAVGALIESRNGALVVCRHCTVFTDFEATAVALDGAGAELYNSVVQGGCALAGASIVFSEGGNLESPGNSCSFDGPGDVHDVLTPALLELGLHGGGTRTRLPQADGPSADTGLDANCQPARDQTGFARPATLCDRGATEAGAPRPPVPIFLDDFRQGHTGAWSDTAP